MIANIFSSYYSVLNTFKVIFDNIIGADIIVF